LNQNELIACDRRGNIHVFNIEENFKLTKKDIFRAGDYEISDLCKIDDKRFVTMGYDGNLKLWEI
jgi:WD40 repeat protein